MKQRFEKNGDPMNVKNVLIIEKDRQAASIMESFDSIFSFTEVSDAPRAGYMLEAGRYQMVVMDCSVSGLSCLSLVKSIRKNEAPGRGDLTNLPDLPYIIILECPDDDVARDAFLKAGADDVISGPARLDEIKKSLNTAHRILTLKDRLGEAYAQMIDVDKAAAIGRLVPGIAHEINNPLGFVSSNLSVLDEYCHKLCDQIQGYRKQAGSDEHSASEADAESKEIDDVMSDIFPLLDECRQGLERIRQLVNDIQQVSHDDDQAIGMNVNDCLDVALNVLWNELKYKSVINKSYGQLPPVFGHPGQLYHLLLHLLHEAGRVIEEKGEINITTTNSNGYVLVTIACSGFCGDQPQSVKDEDDACSSVSLRPENSLNQRLFTARQIVRNYDGMLEQEASPDTGTIFRLRLSVKNIDEY